MSGWNDWESEWEQPVPVEAGSKPVPPPASEPRISANEAQHGPDWNDGWNDDWSETAPARPSPRSKPSAMPKAPARAPKKPLGNRPSRCAEKLNGSPSQLEDAPGFMADLPPTIADVPKAVPRHSTGSGKSGVVEESRISEQEAERQTEKSADEERKKLLAAAEEEGRRERKRIAAEAKAKAAALREERNRETEEDRIRQRENERKEREAAENVEAGKNQRWEEEEQEVDHLEKLEKEVDNAEATGWQQATSAAHLYAEEQARIRKAEEEKAEEESAYEKKRLQRVESEKREEEERRRKDVEEKERLYRVEQEGRAGVERRRQQDAEAEHERMLLLQKRKEEEEKELQLKESARIEQERLEKEAREKELQTEREEQERKRKERQRKEAARREKEKEESELRRQAELKAEWEERERRKVEESKEQQRKAAEYERRVKEEAEAERVREVALRQEEIGKAEMQRAEEIRHAEALQRRLLEENDRLEREQRLLAEEAFFEEQRLAEEDKLRLEQLDLADRKEIERQAELARRAEKRRRSEEARLEKERLRQLEITQREQQEHVLWEEQVAAEQIRAAQESARRAGKLGLFEERQNELVMRSIERDLAQEHEELRQAELARAEEQRLLRERQAREAQAVMRSIEKDFAEEHEELRRAGLAREEEEKIQAQNAVLSGSSVWNSPTDVMNDGWDQQEGSPTRASGSVSKPSSEWDWRDDWGESSTLENISTSQLTPVLSASPYQEGLMDTHGLPEVIPTSKPQSPLPESLAVMVNEDEAMLSRTVTQIVNGLVGPPRGGREETVEPSSGSSRLSASLSPKDLALSADAALPDDPRSSTFLHSSERGHSTSSSKSRRSHDLSFSLSPLHSGRSSELEDIDGHSVADSREDSASTESHPQNGLDREKNSPGVHSSDEEYSEYSDHDGDHRRGRFSSRTSGSEDEADHRRSRQYTSSDTHSSTYRDEDDTRSDHSGATVDSSATAWTMTDPTEKILRAFGVAPPAQQGSFSMVFPPQPSLAYGFPYGSMYGAVPQTRSMPTFFPSLPQNTSLPTPLAESSNTEAFHLRKHLYPHAVGTSGQDDIVMVHNLESAKTLEDLKVSKNTRGLPDSQRFPYDLHTGSPLVEDKLVSFCKTMSEQIVDAGYLDTNKREEGLMWNLFLLLIRHGNSVRNFAISEILMASSRDPSVMMSATSLINGGSFSEAYPGERRLSAVRRSLAAGLIPRACKAAEEQGRTPLAFMLISLPSVVKTNNKSALQGFLRYLDRTLSPADPIYTACSLMCGGNPKLTDCVKNWTTHVALVIGCGVLIPSAGKTKFLLNLAETFNTCGKPVARDILYLLSRPAGRLYQGTGMKLIGTDLSFDGIGGKNIGGFIDKIQMTEVFIYVANKLNPGGNFSLMLEAQIMLLQYLLDFDTGNSAVKYLHHVVENLLNSPSMDAVMCITMFALVVANRGWLGHDFARYYDRLHTRVLEIVREQRVERRTKLEAEARRIADERNKAQEHARMEKERLKAEQEALERSQYEEAKALRAAQWEEQERFQMETAFDSTPRTNEMPMVSVTDSGDQQQEIQLDHDFDRELQERVRAKSVRRENAEKSQLQAPPEDFIAVSQPVSILLPQLIPPTAQPVPQSSAQRQPARPDAGSVTPVPPAAKYGEERLSEDRLENQEPLPSIPMFQSVQLEAAPVNPFFPSIPVAGTVSMGTQPLGGGEEKNALKGSVVPSAWEDEEDEHMSFFRLRKTSDAEKDETERQSHSAGFATDEGHGNFLGHQVEAVPDEQNAYPVSTVAVSYSDYYARQGADTPRSTVANYEGESYADDSPLSTRTGSVSHSYGGTESQGSTRQPDWAQSHAGQAEERDSQSIENSSYDRAEETYVANPSQYYHLNFSADPEMASVDAASSVPDARNNQQSELPEQTTDPYASAGYRQNWDPQYYAQYQQWQNHNQAENYRAEEQSHGTDVGAGGFTQDGQFAGAQQYGWAQYQDGYANQEASSPEHGSAVYQAQQNDGTLQPEYGGSAGYQPWADQSLQNQDNQSNQYTHLAQYDSLNQHHQWNNYATAPAHQSAEYSYSAYGNEPGLPSESDEEPSSTFQIHPPSLPPQYQSFVPPAFQPVPAQPVPAPSMPPQFSPFIPAVPPPLPAAPAPEAKSKPGMFGRITGMFSKKTPEPPAVLPPDSSGGMPPSGGPPLFSSANMTAQPGAGFSTGSAAPGGWSNIPLGSTGNGQPGQPLTSPMMFSVPGGTGPPASAWAPSQPPAVSGNLAAHSSMSYANSGPQPSFSVHSASRPPSGPPMLHYGPSSHPQRVEMPAQMGQLNADIAPGHNVPPLY